MAAAAAATVAAAAIAAAAAAAVAAAAIAAAAVFRYKQRRARLNEFCLLGPIFLRLRL